jgi:hypothetical protein
MTRGANKYDLDAWNKQCDMRVKAVLDAIDLSLIFPKRADEGRQKSHDEQSVASQPPFPR